MPNMIRTTITLPEDIYIDLKHTAIDENKSVSDLIAERVLLKPVKETIKSKKSLLSMAGSVKVKNPIPVEKIRDFINYSS